MSSTPCFLVNFVTLTFLFSKWKKITFKNMNFYMVVDIRLSFLILEINMKLLWFYNDRNFHMLIILCKQIILIWNVWSNFIFIEYLFYLFWITYELILSLGKFTSSVLFSYLITFFPYLYTIMRSSYLYKNH